MNAFLSIFLSSAFLAVLTTPWVIRLARRIGAVDLPGPRGVHQWPIPRIGGVAIFLAAIGPIATVLFTDNVISTACRGIQGQLVMLLGALTLIFLVGLVDDLKDVPARFKLLAEALIAGGLCLGGIRISSIALTDQCVLNLGAGATC